MDLGIKEKAFLVAGGTSGMGLAAALALAAEGAAVVAVGRNADRAAAAADEIRAAGASHAYGMRHLVANGGSIVTTAAYSIRAPEIARLPYASMKSAVATFTKGIAKAYGPKGVRANCVAPGAIETAALTAIRRQVSDAKGYPYDEALERVMVEDWGLDIALRRPGKPSEVGALIAFLLSPIAGYMTGALVNIDGGTNF